MVRLVIYHGQTGGTQTHHSIELDDLDAVAEYLKDWIKDGYVVLPDPPHDCVCPWTAVCHIHLEPEEH